MIRTANPALNEKAFRDYDLTRTGGGQVMTVTGTVHKSALLLALLTVAAGFTWYFIAQAVSGIADPAAYAQAIGGAAFPWMIVGLIVGLILALVTIFVKTAAPFTAPLYALAEGVLLGGLSCYVDAMYPGVAIQAVGATLGVFAVMLALYAARVVRATPRFAIGVMAATGGIFLFYLVEIVLGFFGGGTGLLAFNNGSLLSIGVSVVVVIVAALNLVLDFGFIEDQANKGAPKYMEWFAAFGLLVTLVWLYIEMLRLLSKLQSRN